MGTEKDLEGTRGKIHTWGYIAPWVVIIQSNPESQNIWDYTGKKQEKMRCEKSEENI